MTCFVDISTEFTGGLRGSGTAEIRIWTEVRGQRHEAGPFFVSIEDGTRQRLALESVNEALKHFIRPGQDIVIRMQDPYVRTNMQYLERWHAAEYRKKNGGELKNADQWRLLWMQMQHQRITVEVENAAV